MTIKIAETILLTGAGFTYNFGGFLAERMWAEIFNHPEIQRLEMIRDRVLNDFNYESIYDQILYEPTGKIFSERDRTAIKNAVYEAYKNLDDSIRKFHDSKFRKDDLYIDIKDLFNWVASDNGTAGFFFTLNQDIFVERSYQGEKPLRLPGANVHEIPRRAISSKWEYDLKEEDFITLNKDVATIQLNSLSTKEFNFIKLHGSFNWKSFDGSNAMVIGLDKENHISREPLLKRYFEIFKEVLAVPNRKLLIIGYSFCDKHVNKIIAESVDNHGLKLFVVSPESPQKFVNKFHKRDKYSPVCLWSEEYPCGKSILKGLTGFFPFKRDEGINKTLIESLRAKIKSFT